MSAIVHRSLSATPLHTRTAELAVTNAWVEESGFTVPAAYGSPREEQWALAERVAVSDLSARQTLRFHGPDAADFLNFATLTDVANQSTSQALTVLWCDDAGFVRGLGTLVRRAVDDFELVSAVRDFAWLRDGAEGFDVQVTDVTAERASLGLRGPLAMALLGEAGMLARELPAGDVIDVSLRAARMSVLSLGPGAGFELLAAAEDAILVWDRIWRSGRNLGLAAAGAKTLEVARIEDGRAKPGVDWLPAHLARTPDDFRPPQDFGVTPDLSRRFNGVDGLKRMKNGPRAKLVRLTALEPLIPGQIRAKSGAVGAIKSCAWSETRDLAVALAWLDPEAAKSELSAANAAGGQSILTVVAPEARREPALSSQNPISRA